MTGSAASSPSCAAALGLLLVCLGVVAGCQSTNHYGSYPAVNQADCLPRLRLADQHGREVYLDTLKGKPVLIDFIYTSCTSTCPVLTRRMGRVARLLGSSLGRKVTMVSVTLDPEHDGPPQMLKYAQRIGADVDGWLFVSGKPTEIDRLLKLFRIKRKRGPDGSIMHMTAAFLLGSNGRQIRIYNGLEVSPDTVVAEIRKADRQGFAMAR